MKDINKIQANYQKIEKTFYKNFFQFIKCKIDINLIKSAMDLSENYYDQYMTEVRSNKKGLALSYKYSMIAKEVYRIGSLCSNIKKKDGVDIVDLNEKGNFYYRLADFEKGNFDFITIDKLYTQNSIKKNVDEFLIEYEQVKYNEEYNIRIHQSKDNNIFLLLPKHKFAGFVKTIELKMYIKNDFECDEYIVDEDAAYLGRATIRKVKVKAEQGEILLSDIIFSDLCNTSDNYFVDKIDNFKCELIFPEKISDSELKKLYK